MPEDNCKPAMKARGARSFFDYSTVDPRDFIPSSLQIKLFEEAKKQNTIVCLENENNKLFIAIMLIDHYAHETRYEYNSDTKKIIFLDENPNNLESHANLLKNSMDINVICVSEPEQAFQLELINQAQVIVCTPIAFLHIHRLQTVSIEEINLLIINNIHQIMFTCESETIMEIYREALNKPKILGLSISFSNNKASPENIAILIDKLEKTFDCQCRTTLGVNYAKPKEIIIQVRKKDINLKLTKNFESLFALAKSLLDFYENSKIKPKSDTPITLTNAKHYINTVTYVLENMGFWCTQKLAELYVKEISEIVSVHMEKDQNYVSALSALVSVFNYIRSVINELLMTYSIKDQLIKLSSPKIRCLIQILNDNNPKNNAQNQIIKVGQKIKNKKPVVENGFQCLIYAKRKEVVKVLTCYLKEISKWDINNCSFLKPESLIGQRNLPKNVSELKPNKKQEETLLKFKSNEYNTLVATSNFEERVDIPKCNIVIRYDVPETLRDYLHSKERTKLENSKLMFIIQEGTNEKDELNSFLKQEKILSAKCKDKNDEDSLSFIEENLKVIEEIEKNFFTFKVGEGHGAVTANISNCIAIVNRYCAKLPSDSFTRLFPNYEIIEKLEGEKKFYQCKLKLPINSPIRFEITGDFHITKKLAKKSTALKTCKLLYEHGEVDENFLPITKENIKYIDQLELEPVENESDKKDGTTKKRRFYHKKAAEVLQGTPLQPNEVYFLYAFSLKLTCPIPEEQNTRGRKIVDPGNFARNFGIVSRNKLPKICSFPIFTRAGEVMVTIVNISENIKFDELELKKIENFHKFTFKNVLQLEKYPMKFSIENSDCCYLTVPINLNDEKTDGQIDWEFIEVIETYKKKVNNGMCLKSIENERKDSFVFRREDYEDAVVKPLYHKNEHQFYFYVAEICDNLNPLSEFPNKEYRTFVDYYKEKYGVEVSDLNQPLLDVDYTSARLNLLTPRYVNRKGITLPMSTAKTKKEKRNNLENKQILIPEICFVHPFPASFWKKAVCMPTILYRINCLLLAEELRVEVASAMGIGKVQLDPSETWPALDFGWTLSEVLEKNSRTSNVKNEDLEEITFNSELDDEISSKDIYSPMKQNLNSAIISCDEKNKILKANENKDNEDFIIDVFDPEKYKIRDEPLSWNENYDEEENDLMDDINLGNVDFTNGGAMFDLKSGPINGENFCDWDTEIPPSTLRIENQDNLSQHEKSGIWKNYKSGSNFQVLDLPGFGLTKISGFGNLNLDGLSKDLEIIKDEKNVDLIDNFDSDEDISLEINHFEDDEAAEFDPSYEKFNQYPLNSSINEQEEFIKDLKTNGLVVSNIKKVRSDIIQINELCENLTKNLCLKDNGIDYPNFENRFEHSIFADEDVNCLEFNPNEASFDKIVSKFKSITNLKETDDLHSESLIVKKNDRKNMLKNDYKHFEKLDGPYEPSFGELLNKHQMNDDDWRTVRYCDALNDEQKFQISFDPNNFNRNNFGPDSALILQALTMSNASDGINLERLETVGDSFLKYAVTAYLYCVCDKLHEGKLSYLRSRQISNYNLCKLGMKKKLGEIMVAIKFEPNENWLPPGFVIPKGLEKALVDLSVQNSTNIYDLESLKEISFENLSENELRDEILKRKSKCIFTSAIKNNSDDECDNNYETELQTKKKAKSLLANNHVPYNLLTHHSIPDKSVADCVESLIGAYLISSGPKAALLFMKWLGLKIMPEDMPGEDKNKELDPVWNWLPKFKSPLLSHENFSDFDSLSDHLKQKHLETSKAKLEQLYYGSNLNRFEEEILHYTFKDKAYLVQAFTHNSFYDNNVTDCYQRLEFLGDAVLDFLITRFLFEDPAKHSPGVLTDLRSALVNNTFFASLAVKYDFQKYLKIRSSDLSRVITNFVNKFNQSNGNLLNNFEYGLYVEEGESENTEDVEVPKALGDIFESVAGAIFLDSGLSLDQVWQVYFAMMKPEIEYFSKNVPKSPIRELLEMKPQNAKFGRPELINRRKVAVCVEVFGEGKFIGIGRNKRLAKCTAAKKALRALKKNI